MSKRFYFAAMVAAALVGCNEKVEHLSSDMSDVVQVTVYVPEVQTKVVGLPSEDGVNNLQIFIFNKYGVYETSASGSGSSLTLTCTTGEKQIVALANAPQEDLVRDISDLGSRIFSLEDISAGHLVMTGMVEEDLASDAEVNVPVERIPARVVLNSVIPDFELPQHQNLSFYVEAVYLVNVAGNASYDCTVEPDQWYNLGGCDPENTLDFLYDPAVTTRTMASQDPYETPHHFYCLPNSTETKTRLVIEAQIGGETYYYPITIDSVESNKSYSYNVTVRHLGTDSPDTPLEYGDVTFTVDVDPWVELETEDVIL